MNGRVYDPKLGRFLSPDPFVQAPHSVGGFNRYTYCYNNPLKYTDPSGYVPGYHLSGFDWAYSYAYDRADPRKDNGGAGSGTPDWGGNYQGIWSKLGAGGNSNPGHGFSYYMNKRGYTYAVNNNGIGSWVRKEDIKVIDFASFFNELKSQIDTEAFSLELRFNFNSIQVVGVSGITGLTSSFGGVNLVNFTDYKEATIIGDINGSIVTYPDGKKGREPKVFGEINVAYSNTFVFDKDGIKKYYSSDYQFAIINPLNPKPDVWRNTGIRDYDFGYESGYYHGYRGSPLMFVIHAILATQNETAVYAGYYFRGYSRGKSDRGNFYSNYLNFTHILDIPFP